MGGKTGCPEPFQSPEGAKQLLTAILLAWNIQLAGSIFHFPFYKFPFLGVSIWFLLEIHKEHFSLEFKYLCYFLLEGGLDEDKDELLSDLHKRTNKGWL